MRTNAHAEELVAERTVVLLTHVDDEPSIYVASLSDR